MGFMAGFAKTFVDQYNKQEEVKNDAKKMQLEQKLAIEKEDRTYYREQKKKEETWDSQATSLSGVVGDSSSKTFYLEQLKNGMSYESLLEKTTKGEIVPPTQSGVKVTTTKELPSAPPVAPVTPTDSSVSVPTDITKTPAPVADPMKVPEGVSETVAPQTTTEAPKDGVRVEEEAAPTVGNKTQDVAENVPVIEQPVKPTPKETTNFEEPTSTKWGYKINKDYGVDLKSEEEEVVTLEEMKSKGASSEKIAIQKSRVQIIRQVKMDQASRQAAAEHKDGYWLSRINNSDPENPFVVNAGYYYKNENGDVVDSVGKKVILGSNETWGQATEDTSKQVFEVKSKLMGAHEDLMKRTSATKESIRISQKMTDILIDPRNKDMLTKTASVAENIRGFSKELDAVTSFFQQSEEAMTKNGTVESSVADNALNAAKMADRELSNYLLDVTDEQVRVGVQAMIYENYRVALAYKLAAGSDQKGAAISKTDFERFYNQAGGQTNDPAKAAENLVKMVEVQVSGLMDGQKDFKRTAKNLSQGYLPANVSFEVPRLGDDFPRGTPEGEYLAVIENGIKVKVRYTTEQYEKAFGENASTSTEQSSTEGTKKNIPTLSVDQVKKLMEEGKSTGMEFYTDENPPRLRRIK